ncbi:hypothetical protein [Natranaerofaba carboxydovora]|uniref:hypothetical protein n=1 Tax=Natranaerofaba carboxydovora TaxID=2742683 RepID=UPI001F13A422|nr:hypothetical protein [Natranaerofaba carboxydovora]UMZ73834.1 hypothetical protein ACONDI_01403 [Natranaerofaba carboxydovora]
MKDKQVLTYICVLLFIALLFIGIYDFDLEEETVQKQKEEEKEKDEKQSSRYSYSIYDRLFMAENDKIEYDSIDDSPLENTIIDFWQEYENGNFESALSYLKSPSKEIFEENVSDKNAIHQKIINKIQLDYLGEVRAKDKNGSEFAKVKVELTIPSVEDVYPKFMINSYNSFFEQKENMDEAEKDRLLSEILVETLQKIDYDGPESKVVTENVILKRNKNSDNWKIKEAEFIGIDFPDFKDLALKTLNNKENLINDNFGYNERVEGRIDDYIKFDLTLEDNDENLALINTIEYPDNVELYPEFLSENLNLFSQVRRDIDESTKHRIIETAFINVLNEASLKSFQKSTYMYFCKDEFKFKINESPYIQIVNFDFIEEGKRIYEFINYIREKKAYVDHFLTDSNQEKRKEVFYLQDDIITEESSEDSKYKLILTYPEQEFLKSTHLNNFNLKFDIDEEEFTEIVNVLFEETYEEYQSGEDILNKDVITRSLELNKDNKYVFRHQDDYPEIDLPFID